MRTRAFRRHKLETVKKRVVRYCTCPIKDEKWVGRVAATPKPCSCPMCGNPRKWSGELTPQERAELDQWEKALDDLQRQFDEQAMRIEQGARRTTGRIV